MHNAKKSTIKTLKVQLHKIKNATYKDVWDFQMLLHNRIKKAKSAYNLNNKNKAYNLNHVVLTEHLPVYTLGKSADRDNLLQSRNSLEAAGFEIFDINRGGDITYHGPGQITAYLILDLEQLFRDVHLYVRNLELIVILLLADYGLKGLRVEGHTGVWLKEGEVYSKICAIGVHLSRWVSMHGLALNVNTDLNHFHNIIPCGIDDTNKEVTSLAQALGKAIDIAEVESRLCHHMSQVFGLHIVNNFNK